MSNTNDEFSDFRPMDKDSAADFERIDTAIPLPTLLLPCCTPGISVFFIDIKCIGMYLQ